MGQIDRCRIPTSVAESAGMLPPLAGISFGLVKDLGMGHCILPRSWSWSNGRIVDHFFLGVLGNLFVDQPFHRDSIVVYLCEDIAL